MYQNINAPSLDVTASSTPTAYALPSGSVTSWRIVNSAGSDVVLKAETSSTTTLTAPVSGTPYTGTRISTGAVELFNTNPNHTHISVYSASGTGTVSIQALAGEQ